MALRPYCFPAGPERGALPRLVSGRPFGSKAPDSGNFKRVPGPGTSAAFCTGCGGFFDLDCNPDLIYETLQRMNELRPGLCVPGTRVPGRFDAFETAVRAILGQQITVKAASTLAGRLAERFGAPSKPESRA